MIHQWTKPLRPIGLKRAVAAGKAVNADPKEISVDYREWAAAQDEAILSDWMVQDHGSSIGERAAAVTPAFVSTPLGAGVATPNSRSLLAALIDSAEAEHSHRKKQFARLVHHGFPVHHALQRAAVLPRKPNLPDRMSAGNALRHRIIESDSPAIALLR